MQVVAEGVEHAADQRRLLGLGCDLFQGFGLARPLPPQRLAALLRTGFATPLADLESCTRP
jgi:EAL domain-containing protein (putative c-di-GMP-specific phosphodiesterase class I)